jgi:cyanophycinase-like exopeptidase
MASADGERAGEAKARDLRALGAEAVNVWLTRAQADGDSAAALLGGATGVWFGGGDQSRLTRAIRGTRVERASASGGAPARWSAARRRGRP